jgi:hypothetical protein
MSTRLSAGSPTSIAPSTVFSYTGSLAAGDVVYLVSSANQTVAKADADGNLVPPIGIVERVASNSACVVAINGEICSSLTGLTAGTTYWLSTTAGTLVSTKPASNAYVVGVAVSSTELLVDTMSANLIFNTSSGTVTSVNVTGSNGISVSGSPITSGSGTITVEASGGGSSFSVADGGTGLTSTAGQGALLLASSSSSYVSQVSGLSWRNRAMNGDMVVNQRQAVSTTSDFGYPVDRWRIRRPAGGLFTGAQSTTAPPGFKYSFAWTSNTGTTPSPTEVAGIVHVIEGTSVYDLKWGTADALPITISFWVRASMTGTYAVWVNNAAAEPNTIWYLATYTVSSSNTWERKVITVPGATFGTWLTNESGSLAMCFDLGGGSTVQTTTVNTWSSGAVTKRSLSTAPNVVGTTGATFFLTGVQLEQGTVATPFEQIWAETQLQLCQRYYFRINPISSSPLPFYGTVTPQFQSAVNICRATVFYPQTMRSTPTLSTRNLARYSTPTARTAVTAGTASFGTLSAGFDLSGISAGSTTTINPLSANNTTDSYVEFSADI